MVNFSNSKGAIVVKLNDDKELVSQIRTALKENEGYCPCKIEKNKYTKCMCKEFREQIEDESFVGECHCGLYVKTKEGE